MKKKIISQTVLWIASLLCLTSLSGQVSVSGTHTTPGASEGTISVSVSGDAGHYTISIDGPLADEEVILRGTVTFENLPAGLYSIKVVDAFGCETLIIGRSASQMP